MDRPTSGTREIAAPYDAYDSPEAAFAMGLSIVAPSLTPPTRAAPRVHSELELATRGLEM